MVWVDLWSGSVLFDDVSTLVFPRKRAFFPITPDSWIRPLGDEFGELVLTPKKTTEVVADANFWLSLQVFHRALCECEFVNKKLANVDEYVRLQAKAHHKEAAEEAAYDAIGAVMRTESDTPRELLDAIGSEPVLKACALVGHAFGIEVRGQPRRDRGPGLRGAGRRDRRVVGLPHPPRHAARRLVELRPRPAARPARRDARCRWRCCRRARAPTSTSTRRPASAARSTPRSARR